MSEKARTFRKAAAAATAVVLLVAGCGGLLGPGDDGGREALYETTRLTVSTGGAGFAPQSIQPSPSDVVAAELVIEGVDAYGDPLDLTVELSQNGSAWEATVGGLPVGPELTFTIHAYDDVLTAPGKTELYTGNLTAVLTGVDDSLTIALEPIGIADPVAFPIIQSITRPAEIVTGTAADVQVGLRGNVGEELDVVITAGTDGGSFAPASATVTVSASGSVDLQSVYSAPAAIGTYTHEVTVTNSQGNSVSSSFTTTVVAEAADAAVTTSFAPSVTSLSAYRQGGSVYWTAAVSDDGDPGDLSFLWSFSDAGASFSPADQNPGVLTGYEQNDSGTITLTVTDGDGLATSLTFELVAGQFPDGLVVEPSEPPEWSVTTIDGHLQDYRVGQDTSLAIGPGPDHAIHISHLDSTEHALRYTTNASGAWISTILDDVSSDTGRHSSIAVDGDGHVHISYWDESNGHLRYATDGGGLWETSTVDGSGDVSGSSSICVGDGGAVHITYSSSGGPATYSKLRYVRKAADEDPWTSPVVVDESVTANVGNHSSIALDGGGFVHVSYYTEDGNRLRYAHNTSGVFSAETVPLPDDPVRSSAGHFTSMAVDSSGAAHIAYSWFGTQVTYATNTGGAWDVEEIDYMGGDPSLALDSSDAVHISYANTPYLAHATKAVDGTWSFEGELDGGGDPFRSVGEDSSIALDSNDQIHISYYDFTNRALMYATTAP